MPSSTVYNILEACRQPGCPLCRLEAQSVERYLDNHFYENVNSPRWRDELRASLGFCREHAWLGVDQRLGDALGYSIIYHDLIGSVLKGLEKNSAATQRPRRVPSLLRKLPEAARDVIGKALDAITPRKRCPVCEQREQVAKMYVSVLVEELSDPEMISALQVSDGLCLPHLRITLEHIRDVADLEQLLRIQREKLEELRTELSEFIRKNEYQAVKEGFGREGDAWLRAIAMIAGKGKRK